MKKLRLASFCLAVFSLGSLCACTPSVAPPVSPSASPSPTVAEALPFGAEDLTIQGLRLGQSTLEQAKEHLGEGYDESTYTLGVDQSRFTSLISDAITYTFVEQNGVFILSHININDPSIPGPRGTKVGDKEEAILEKFPQSEPPVVEEDTVVLYRANPETQTGVSIPPCGLNTGDQIAYYAPIQPYAFDPADEQAALQFDLATDTNYALFYEISEGVVTAIYLRYGSDQDAE